jgi:hypothetical protein
MTSGMTGVRRGYSPGRTDAPCRLDEIPGLMPPWLDPTARVIKAMVRVDEPS